MAKNVAVILAAGEGKRMKSAKPKAMAEVLFKPMINWVMDCVTKAGVSDYCVVTGHLSEILCAHLGEGVPTVLQSERLGTGHAVMQAKAFLEQYKDGNVLVLNGDAPLMDAATVSGALEAHVAQGNAVTVISAKVPVPFGYGRIVRKADGALLKIVEEKEADAQTKAINEVNSGAFWFQVEALLEALETLIARPKSSTGEYYLTDAVELLLAKGKNANAYPAENPNVVLGANDRVQLQELNEIARKEILCARMRDGVSIPCLDGVIIGPDVTIGQDTEILPGCILRGKTAIGMNCEIGPGTVLDDVTVEDGVSLNNVHGQDAKVCKGAGIGPYVRLRPNTVIGEDVKIGNFVEIKNSNIGADTSIAHLSYIGDSDFGTGINVGCGLATANFTGKEKFRTVVGNDAFIGCHNALVAPVTIGDRAYTAAGSTITKDVPADALALGRAEQRNLEGWVTRTKPYREKKKK